jgi:hypothetical protein
MRVPEEADGEKEHWKSEVPDVGSSELIRDFRLLAKQGTKRVYHALVEANKVQLNRIKTYIENYNDGLPAVDRLGYWHGRTAEDAFKNLWQDRSTHSLIDSIAKTILHYPIKTETGDPDHPALASIQDAEDSYGLTIDPQKIKIPHRFLGA